MKELEDSLESEVIEKVAEKESEMRKRLQEEKKSSIAATALSDASQNQEMQKKLAEWEHKYRTLQTGQVTIFFLQIATCMLR